MDVVAIKTRRILQIGETQMLFQPARAYDQSTLMRAAPDHPAPPPLVADRSANMTRETLPHTDPEQAAKYNGFALERAHVAG